MATSPKKHLLSLHLTKYLVAGCAAFAAEYLSFYVMISSFGVALYVANTLSFCIGLMTSFLLNRLWTFGGKQYSKGASHQLSFYIILATANLMLTNLLVAIFTNAGINPKIGKLIAMIVTSSWNFILFKYIIFRHKKQPNDQH